MRKRCWRGAYKTVGEWIQLYDAIDEAKLIRDFAFGEDQYNVRDYGAVGDGVTDDTVAAQAAIDAAGAAGGGYVIFDGPGGYNIQSSLLQLSPTCCWWL